jgi:hypothetical protein
VLRPDTQKLWDRLRVDRALAGFVLIGGSALSLHFSHRLSEDLDLAFIGPGPEPAVRLPRRLLEQLLAHLRTDGQEVESRDSAVSWREFEAAGMDLHDYQQDYLIGGVRVSFFAPDHPLNRVLGPGEADGVRLASVEELFRAKALAAADRSKTRDWYDLHHLMTAGGFSMQDFARAFEDAGVPAKLGIALNRLCSGQSGIGDEGFAATAAKPPTIVELTRFFVEECGRLEITQGRQRFVEKEPPKGSGTSSPPRPPDVTHE